MFQVTITRNTALLDTMTYHNTWNGWDHELKAPQLFNYSSSEAENILKLKLTDSNLISECATFPAKSIENWGRKLRSKDLWKCSILLLLGGNLITHSYGDFLTSVKALYAPPILPGQMKLFKVSGCQTENSFSFFKVDMLEIACVVFFQQQWCTELGGVRNLIIYFSWYGYWKEEVGHYFISIQSKWQLRLIN